MKGGLWPPFLRHGVVTVRCKVRVQRGDLQLRAYAPPGAPSPWAGPWTFTQHGLATVSSKSETEQADAKTGAARSPKPTQWRQRLFASPGNQQCQAPRSRSASASR